METKIKILKIFLKISAIFQMFWWGFSHLFYPAWYHKIVGITGIDFMHGFVAAAANERGDRERSDRQGGVSPYGQENSRVKGHDEAYMAGGFSCLVPVYLNFHFNEAATYTT